jgi:hypothetical protein
MNRVSYLAGNSVLGETARDEPRVLPRREHSGSPKGRYHDWQSITNGQALLSSLRETLRIYLMCLL